jgi:hypothetical protein
MYEVEVLQDDAAPEGTLDAQAVAVYMFHGEHPPPAAEREVTRVGVAASYRWKRRPPIFKCCGFLSVAPWCFATQQGNALLVASSTAALNDVHTLFLNYVSTAWLARKQK